MNFEKKNNIYKIFMTIVVTVIVTFIITSLLFYNYFLRTGKGITKILTTSNVNDFNSKIKLIEAYIEKYYLGEKDEDKMMEYAVKGYVAGLGDKYTEYLTKDEYEDLMVDINGDFTGIGIYISQDEDGNVVILMPIKGSPAEEAGLKTGDIIYKVNGEDCTGMDVNIVSKKIRGDEGTTVDLEIIRNNKTIKKTIERKSIKTSEIESKVLNNNIGYIQIISFVDGCADEFETKLNELLEKGVKSLIIDVRDNGGGVVSEATQIAELFVDKGNKIMIEVDKNGNSEVTKSTKNAKVSSNINVIVLANENSASATEILLGALKDNGIAKIVGTKTFGKGVMQDIVPMTTGGALKITIKEFSTPNGNRINKEGITPDIEVKEKENNSVDEQLEKAIELCK